ncbi:MAG: triose-phosphate isomerase [Thermovirgaceae bacterium]|nr:triose-phosphate isomerase [Thermovirgaceae bacterium]
MKGKGLIAGNWKMNKGIGESMDFLGRFVDGLEREGSVSELIPASIEIVIFPPIANLYAIKHAASLKKGVYLGVQNVHWKASGAFTGENSVSMAVEAGAVFALIGHSERRQIFLETDEMTSKKFNFCVKNGLKPVLCVGETDEDRKNGLAEAVITRQVIAVLGSREFPADFPPLIIAYEPVWAIGTENNATANDAQESCAAIRKVVGRSIDAKTAGNTLLLYGGSVKSSNAEDYLKQDDIDGLLVGGASLDPDEFLGIIRAASFLI